MAVVLKDKKLIIIPMPSIEKYSVLDNLFTTKTLTLPNGDKLLAVPHTRNSLRVINNMKIDTTGCDLFDCYYKLPKSKTNPHYNLFWYQYETAKFLTQNPYAFCTSTPRTGKTLATLTAADCVIGEHGGSVLIVAPLTIADKGEWTNSLIDWFPHRKFVFVHKDRENELRQDVDFYIINPNGLKICENTLTNMVNSGKITVVVFDELTEYGNGKSGITESAMRISRNAKFRWGLTGTPGGPDKIYSQIKLINPDNVPKYFTRWREMTMYKATPFKWLPREGHEEIIKEAMSPCIRFDKDEVLDIPTPTLIHEHTDLSSDQQVIVDKLTNEMLVAVESGEITVATASTLAQKILQVSGGVVKTSEGVHKVDSTPKLNKLTELLNRTPAKKVVFSNFVAVNDMLVEFIRSQGMTCEKIDGAVTGNKRGDLIKNFMETDYPHVLVCHPRTMSYGIDLAIADMIICYGPPMSGTYIYQQLVERISSVKQKAEETFIVHLSAGSTEKRAFSALGRGVDLEKNIIKIFTNTY